MFDFARHPHRRFNPLTGDWLLVSPQRTQRPWQGKVEKTALEKRPSYDPKCYLCPGNIRANQQINPQYTSTFVFDNDFPALLKSPSNSAPSSSYLFQSSQVQGTCRVICFSPRHDITLAEMNHEEIVHVVNLWIEQYNDLHHTYRWVQIFENKGEIMGCSNPHPHGQIWASSSAPNEPAKEDREQKEYYERNHSILLCDYIEEESRRKERIVVENADWIVVVPFWAVWPFETLLIPRRHILHLHELTVGEQNNLAAILKNLLVRYDNLFETSFPYSMGWHGAPGGVDDSNHWQLHAHFYPPLLRSATIKKFLVGYEMLGEAQRDLTPESAAQRLRECSSIHYSLERHNSV